MAANNISQLTTANTFQHWLTATQSLIATANLITNGNGNTFYANTILEVGGTGSSLNVVTSATINDQHSNTINTVSLAVSGNIARANITGPVKVGTSLSVYDVAAFSSDVDIAGTLDITGDTTVTGNTALNKHLTVANNVTIGGETAITGNTTIGGNLTVTGNIVLDSIGFDDLQVTGSGSFGNTLNVTGATTLSTVNAVAVNVSTNVIVTHDTTTDNLIVNNTATVGGNLTVSGDATVTGSITADELLGNANTIIYAAIAAAREQAEGSAVALSIALG